MTDRAFRVRELLAERGIGALDPLAPEVARAEGGLSEEEAEEQFGHGPLRGLWDDAAVTELLVNGPAEIWFEKRGTLARAPGAFRDEESLRRYVRRLLAPLGRKVDPRAPFADAVLPCGTRVHVAVPPVARRGICLSLRRPPVEPWSLARLQAEGSLSEAAAAKLRALVKERRNLFVCGGTGTGKTSMLGALLGEADPRERILALEDVAELRTTHPHFLSLEARPANQEGEGELTLTRLLREALRMRPDRLVVGECRGAEALDLLLALNSGHPGSFGTIHASSAREALHRLETLALLAAENLRESAVKTLIGACVHAVVLLERGPGGRRVAGISEVRGWEGGTYQLREAAL